MFPWTFSVLNFSPQNTRQYHWMSLLRVWTLGVTPSILQHNSNFPNGCHILELLYYGEFLHLDMYYFCINNIYYLFTLLSLTIFSFYKRSVYRGHWEPWFQSSICNKYCSIDIKTTLKPWIIIIVTLAADGGVTVGWQWGGLWQKSLTTEE